MTMDFNGFIEEVSASVRANLKDVNDIQIEEFEKYLKEAIATELVTSARSTITVMGTSDKVTSNLKSALIASTIACELSPVVFHELFTAVLDEHCNVK